MIVSDWLGECPATARKLLNRDRIIWQTDHLSIGCRVAVSVSLNGKSKSNPLFGTVTKFAQESKVEEFDHLYFIRWDTGDEDEISGFDLVTGLNTYKLYEALDFNHGQLSDVRNTQIDKPFNTFMEEHFANVKNTYNCKEKSIKSNTISKSKNVQQSTIVKKSRHSFDSSSVSNNLKYSDTSVSSFKQQQKSLRKSSSKTSLNPSTKNVTIEPSLLVNKKSKFNHQLIKNDLTSEIHYDENGWTLCHSTVGTRVAGKFIIQKQKKGMLDDEQIYFGSVVKFAPETSKGKHDELYHIMWDDGDEQDYDIDELNTGVKLYNEYESR